MTTETIATQEFLAANVPAQFQDNTLITLYEQVKKEVRSEVQDVTTVDGRKAIRETVQKITATKKAIDDQLRNYLRELKALPRVVEKSARENLERFDSLKEEVAQKMQEAYEPQRLAFESLDQTAKICSTFAIPLHELEKQREEVELIDLEMFWPEHKPKARKKIKEALEAIAKAVEVARVAAEKQAELDRARAEKEAAEREALKAKLEAEAQIKAQEAVERAKRDAEEAKQRAAIQHAQELQKAQQAAEMAAKIERDRLAAQEAAKIAEAEKRAADKQHTIAVNRAALASFIEQGFDEATAKKVITLIAQHKIKNITINY